MLFLQPEEGHLTLDFEFTKTAGKRQLMVVFGKNESGYYKWEIGGWANDMSCIGKSYEGSYGLLTVGKSITLEENRRYHASLVLDGRTILAKVDGEIYHSYTEPETVIEPLYHCASIEENGKIYIKAVNIKAESVSTEFSVEGAKNTFRQVVWHLLASDDLKAENTFEEPDRILPAQKTFCIEGNAWVTELPPQSVSVFELIE